MVPDAQTKAAASPGLPSGYEAHATIDEYYKHLGAKVPVHSLIEEVAVDETDPQEALKDGNSTHKKESEAEDVFGGKNQKEFETNLPLEKKATQEAIEDMMNEPSGGGEPVIAVVGSVPGGPQAGEPEMVVPMGYTATQRRPIGVDVNGGPYDEMNIIGVGYVMEQSTKLKQSPAEVDPALYRCAHTCARGAVRKTRSLQPGLRRGDRRNRQAAEAPAVLAGNHLGGDARGNDERQDADLKAAGEGGALPHRSHQRRGSGDPGDSQRQLGRDRRSRRKRPAAGEERQKSAAGTPCGNPRGRRDSVNVFGLPTSAGSIALENTMPSSDATVVAKLKAAGAIILGDTNTSELGGTFEGPNMPQGYSSLGGQVLLAADTNKNVGGSSGGAADAVAVGLAPLAIGTETSTTEGAQLIAPAGNAGDVGLKPTVGLVSRSGTLPDAKSQETLGPIGMTVKDVATTLGVLAGPDPSDPATLGQPPVPNYLTGLTATALSGKKIAVV